MLKNYILIAFRNLARHKLHAAINIFGLALGIACCVTLLLYVKNELSYDSFHVNKNRLYRGWFREEFGDSRKVTHPMTPFPFGKALKENFPEVEETSLYLPVNWKIEHEGVSTSETVHVVSEGFFNMFSFKVIDGDASDALARPDGIVLTQASAKRFFGNGKALGNIITFKIDDQSRDFHVRAVVEDPSSNSSITFQFLVSDQITKDLFDPRMQENWFAILGENYVMLREDTDVEALHKKFPALISKVVDAGPNNQYIIGLQSLTDIHMNPDFPRGLVPVSDPRYAYILGGIALLIVIIGCINFVTLSVSKSVSRAKEVGLRKVVGAIRTQLIQQYLSETMMLVFFGLLGGLMLTALILPYFNELSALNLRFTVTPFLLLTSLALVIVIGIIAGSYPALILSSLQPVAILKGNTIGKPGKRSLRNVLLGIQFFFALSLIASTLIMKDQLRFLQQKDLGFNREQVITVPLRVQAGRIGQTIKKGMEVSETFRHALQGYSQINGIASASYLMGESWAKIGYTSTEGNYKEFFLNVVSPEYIRVMEMRMKEGRDFDINNLADFKQAVIVNEAFLRDMQWTSAVGKRIPGPNFIDHEIIGVVRDFNYASLYGAVEPAVMVLDFSVIAGGFDNINLSSSPSPKLMVKFATNQASETVEAVKNVWANVIGNDEFSYGFMDERLLALYRAEENMGKMVTVAGAIAMTLGALGLFAFAALSIQHKMKELSIRKVLGASETGIFVLVARQYIILLTIALLIATPVSWYVMHQWLQSFAYRIALHPLYFLLTGIIAMLISMFTIGYHALSAARTAPVKNLRVE